MSPLLVLLVALPLLGGLLAALTGPAREQLAGRVGTALTGVAFLLGVLLAAAVLADGPVSAVFERADGRAVGGLYADRLSAVLVLLVCAVSGVVQAFAQRYLRADPRAGRFFAATGLLTAATLALVTSATLIGLAIAWSLAGLALLALLGLYAELPAAREGVRRTARAFALGDLALWAAVVVALFTWGNLDLRSLGAQLPRIADDELALAVVACGLVIAALARSAQLPFGRWLPATLAAPTPVSALLHAGVVNAGGVLLVRLAPLFGASQVATHLAFAAGAATALYGTSLMLVKPDVKGGLAHSTMGQMGFMIMVCGLGAFAAVIFHLVAHGMYKATLFLGSGAAVGGHVRHAKAPPATDLT
ncbi:MAG: sodium:proton antiporter, partial [Solirubrobacterales bacterium]|nr:sodium:proton antiporter [Solirubrobacterales bacterium]